MASQASPWAFKSRSRPVSVPSSRGCLRRSGPLQPGTGSAGRARQGRSKPGASDSLLPKPDRPGWSPATAGTAQVEVAVALSVIVRWGPARTAVSGTTSKPLVWLHTPRRTRFPGRSPPPSDGCAIVPPVIGFDRKGEKQATVHSNEDSADKRTELDKLLSEMTVGGAAGAATGDPVAAAVGAGAPLLIRGLT
jgi:hypothetical protein